MTERTEVAVVGGGQAGLAAGFYLARAGIPFLILDAGARVGDAWRRRWDSLTLFTAARYSALPGLAFPGDPEHFPGKDEVAGYLEQYAHTFQLPVKLNRRVTALEPADGGYRLATTAGACHAAQVIVAAGAYQRPYIPAAADGLSADVTQLHSADYRNPDQIPGRVVLVAGAANSRAGIAEGPGRHPPGGALPRGQAPAPAAAPARQEPALLGRPPRPDRRPAGQLARPHPARRAAGRAEPAHARPPPRHHPRPPHRPRQGQHRRVQRQPRSRGGRRGMGHRLPPRLHLDPPADLRPGRHPGPPARRDRRPRPVPPRHAAPVLARLRAHLLG